MGARRAVAGRARADAPERVRAGLPARHARCPVLRPRRRFLSAFFPPDFITPRFEIPQGLLESLTVTVTSTVFGVILSVPVASGASRNLAPMPIYLVCRGRDRGYAELVAGSLRVRHLGTILPVSIAIVLVSTQAGSSAGGAVMAVIANGDGAELRMRRTTAADLTAWFGRLGGVALTVLCFQFISDQTIWPWCGTRRAADLLDRAFPPPWAYAHRLWRAMRDRINIATLGTAPAIAVGVPVAFLAAHNTTPSRVFARPVALCSASSRRGRRTA